MKLNQLDGLMAFWKVAEHRGFTKAAAELEVSASALSQAIRQLESRLGVQLLHRTTRSVSLTAEGEVLLPLARRLLADWDDTEEMLRQRFTLQLGRVSVAAMPAFAGNLLPHSLKVFRQRYPKVNVTVHDVINEQVLELVRHRRVELGIGFEPENIDGLDFHPLYLDRFVAVVPADSPLALLPQVSWAQLMAEDFVALQRPSAVRLLMEQNVAAHHGKLAVAFESHQLATIGRMVASGLGVSAVPALCINQMQELGARCITLVEPTVERRIGVIALSEHKLSTAAQALLEVLLSNTRIPEVTCVT